MEINEIEKRKTIEKINKTRSWFFEKIDNIDQHTASLMKGKKEGTQIINIRSEKMYIAANIRKIKRIIRKYYANKLDNAHEMNKFLQTYITESDSRRNRKSGQSYTK